MLIHVDKADVRVLVCVKHKDFSYKLKGQWLIVDFQCQPKIDDDIYIKDQPQELQLIVILKHPQHEKMKKFGECHLKIGEFSANLEKCLDKHASISYSLTKQQLDMDIQLDNPISSQSQLDQKYYIKQVDDLRKKIANLEQQIKKQTTLREQREKQCSSLSQQLKKSEDKQRNALVKIEEIQAKLEEKSNLAEYHRKQLEKSKKKLASILDILYERGESELLQLLQTLINQ